jgi:AAHS family 4-hydroxybenzoate transporter-like MFS transporter
MTAETRTIDVAGLLDDRRLTPFNYKLILLSWLITLFDGLDMTMVSYTAPYMRDELGLSKYMLGSVFSASVFGMVVGGIVLSSVGDRIGRRPAVLIAAFAFGVVTILTGFARSYPELLALRFLDGVAAGGMLPLAWALNIEFVPRRMRATVVTIIMMGYSFGGVISGPLTNAVAPRFGWEGVYFVGGGATLLCALALAALLPESVRFLVNKGRSPDKIARILNRIDPAFAATSADRFVLGDETVVARASLTDLFRGDLAFLTPLLWLTYGASSLAIYFNSSWGPLLLEELKVERSTAALISSANGMVGAIAGLFLMRFTDRLGPKAVAFYPALAVPVLLLLGLGLVPPELFLTFVVLGGLLIGGEHSGVISITAIFYPSAVRASGGGWASSIGKLGGVIGPMAGAVVLSSGMPVLRAYALLAICPAIIFTGAMLIAAVVRRRRSIDHVAPINAVRGGHAPAGSATAA